MAKLSAKQLKELDKLHDEVFNEVDVVKSKDEIDIVLSKFIKKVKNNLKKDGSNASGKLSASIKPLPAKTREGIITYMIEMEDYWKKVDEGSKPIGFSKENLKELQPKIFKWIQNKPQLQEQVEANKRKSLSYAIATNILKKGTIKRFNYNGSRFLSREIETFEKNLIKAFE
jgi:hypothetical protein